MCEKIYTARVAVVEAGQRIGSIQSHTSLEWLPRQDQINGPALVRGIRGMMLSGLLAPASGRKKPARSALARDHLKQRPRQNAVP